MQISPEFLLSIGVAAASAIGSWYTVRERVRVLQEEIKSMEVRHEKIESRLLENAKFLGAYEILENQIKNLEKKVDSFEEKLSSIREEFRRENQQTKDFLLSLTSKVDIGFREMRDIFHALDKRKISTDDFRAVTGEHKVYKP